MKSKANEIVRLFGAPVIVIVILFTVYAIKGIYPFGNNSIAYYDMTQSMIPLYYHTWDVLHGTKSVFWDWYSGLGGSMADTMGNFVFSPFNLFFLFVRRESVMNSMSVFLCIKMSIAAIAMSFYTTRKRKDVSCILSILAGVNYSACGYVIQYYTNINFIDIVCIFPLIVYALERMMNDSKMGLYTIIMALGFMINIYLMFMVCIYIIFKSFFIIKKSDKTSRRSASALLGISTIVSLLLSAFSWLPMAELLMKSQRTQTAAGQNGYLDSILTFACYESGQKLFMLYGSESVLAIVLWLMIFKRKSISKYIDHIVMLILLVLPIFVEGINLVWHMGGYVQFPMRFGYMLTFEAVCLLTDVVQDCKWAENDTLWKRIVIYLSIAFIPVLIIILYKFENAFCEYGIRDLDMYNGYGLIIVVVVIEVFMAFLSDNRRIVYCIVGITIISQACIGIYSFVGPSKEYSIECSRDLLNEAISSETMLANNLLDSRNKDVQNSMITNYPLITRTAAISNWTWGTNPRIWDNLCALGYSIAYTRFLDNGGTYFSDMLLGVRTMISEQLQDNSLYSLNNQWGNKFYYEYSEHLPFGILTDSEINLTYSEDFFENQNMLFKAITDTDANIISEYTIRDLEIEKTEYNTIKASLPIAKESKIYIYSPDHKKAFLISINGEIVRLPYLTNTENVFYPSIFQNGIIDCGTYSDQVLTLEFGLPEMFKGEEDALIDNVVIGTMDIGLMRKACENIGKRQHIETSFGKRNMRIQGEVTDDGYILLPVGYNEGWRAKQNDEEMEVLSGLNHSLILLPVNKGKVDVKLWFLPQGFREGIILLCIGMIAFIVMIITNKKRALTYIADILGKISLPILYSLTIGLVLFMYIVPIVAWFVL